ncbi:MAG: 30S ribosomal protein S9 [Patescibacteria group bacterium]
MITEKSTTKKAVGRRKTASARVRVTPGSGIITVNGRLFENYFPLRLLQQKVRGPLLATGKEKAFDVSVKVAGGGMSGQAEAVTHGIARALLAWNPELKPLLRSEGFLTRDPRSKERKKFGRHRARRGHQWRKR